MTDSPSMEASRAMSAADQLFTRYGRTAEIQIVGLGTFVVTVRDGSSIHVVAGTARECLSRLESA
jgi:hypothetical protein